MSLKFPVSSLIASAKRILRSPHPYREPAFYEATHRLHIRKYASGTGPIQCYSSQSYDSPTVYSFFEKQTSTWQYIVSDPLTLESAIIDSVLDYEPASGTISTTTADGILSFIRQRGLNIKYILETHAHADHLSAAQYYRRKTNAPVGIGRRIAAVQKKFGLVYGFEPSSFVGAFDLLFQDDERFKLGRLNCQVIHLPGHTPDHVGYVFGESIFTGDSIFHQDLGSARCDFPGGDAKMLFSSMQRLISFPDSFRLFVGHDYPVGRDQICVSTVGEQRHSNKHSRKGISEAEFTAYRNSRDSLLGAPRLLHPSLQTNIRGGKLPPRDVNGLFWFKTPITTSVDL
ncbi:Metallo-hydrolase/oxidoreductase [Mycena crocata]|nr:Metallo-hydrolase/oxidoreductase [Mycena crocata]